MKNSLRAWYRRQQFNPTWIGPFVNPFFLARRHLWRAIEVMSREVNGPLLDVGCGTKPYRDLFRVDRYVGLDIDTASTRQLGIADAYYTGQHFPFRNGEFNAVLCNQVLEHVRTPDELLGEIRRVLSARGRLLLTVPFVWDEHEQPHDYLRYSSFGLRAALERNGFRIIHQEKLLANISIVFQLINAYAFKVMHARSAITGLLITAAMLAPISLLGWILGNVLPRNPDLYLDQLVLAERLP